MSPAVTADEIQSLTRQVEKAIRGQTNQETLKGIDEAIDVLADVQDELSAWVAVTTDGVVQIAEEDLARLDELLEKAKDARKAIELDRMAAQAINTVQTLSAAIRAVNDRLAPAITRPIEKRLFRLRETQAITSRLSEGDLPAHTSAMTQLESLATHLPEIDRSALAEAIGKADAALERANGLWENLPPVLQELYQDITENGRIRLSEIPDATLLVLRNSPLAPSLDIGLSGSQQEDAN